MKIKIELTPYNALTLLSFIREFVNEENEDEYQFKAIHQAADQLEQEIADAMTEEHWEEVDRENQINQLIGKSPTK